MSEAGLSRAPRSAGVEDARGRLMTVLLGGVERGVVQDEIVHARAPIQHGVDDAQLPGLRGGEERGASVRKATIDVDSAGDEQLDDAREVAVASGGASIAALTAHVPSLKCTSAGAPASRRART